jgi:hypothetical protein
MATLIAGAVAVFARELFKWLERRQEIREQNERSRRR